MYEVEDRKVEKGTSLSLSAGEFKRFAANNLLAWTNEYKDKMDEASESGKDKNTTLTSSSVKGGGLLASADRLRSPTMVKVELKFHGGG